MREIKFRAWHKADEKMYEVYGFSKRQWFLKGKTLPMPPGAVEILQYTGLKDKNGKDIYEGDILEYGYVVTFVDGSDLANLGMEVGFYCQRDDFESWALLEVGAEYEVIGNIYENPELIKS